MIESFSLSDRADSWTLWWWVCIKKKSCYHVEITSFSVLFRYVQDSCSNFLFQSLEIYIDSVALIFLYLQRFVRYLWLLYHVSVRLSSVYYLVFCVSSADSLYSFFLYFVYSWTRDCSSSSVCLLCVSSVFLSILLKTVSVCSSDFEVLFESSSSSHVFNCSFYLVITILLLTCPVWARILSVSDLTLIIPIGDITDSLTQCRLYWSKGTQFKFSSLRARIRWILIMILLSVSLNLRVVPDDLTIIFIDVFFFFILSSVSNSLPSISSFFRLSFDCNTCVSFTSKNTWVIQWRYLLFQIYEILISLDTFPLSLGLLRDSFLISIRRRDYIFSRFACLCINLVNPDNRICMTLFFLLGFVCDISYPFFHYWWDPYSTHLLLSACFRIFQIQRIYWYMICLQKRCIDKSVSLSSASPISCDVYFWRASHALWILIL